MTCQDKRCQSEKGWRLLFLFWIPLHLHIGFPLVLSYVLSKANRSWHDVILRAYDLRESSAATAES